MLIYQVLIHNYPHQLIKIERNELTEEIKGALKTHVLFFACFGSSLVQV